MFVKAFCNEPKVNGIVNATNVIKNENNKLMDKIKTLSQAIRLGATFRPQGQGELLTPEGESCAYGAAMEGCGFTLEIGGRWPNTKADDKMHVRFPELSYIRCAIEFKNDNGETREQIADWLESQGL